MPVNFTSPTGEPVSFGDQYRLFQSSSAPKAPPPSPQPDGKNEKLPAQDAGVEAEEQEEDPAEEPPAKKSRKSGEGQEGKDDNKADGEGSDAVKDTEDSPGREAAVLPVGSDEANVGAKEVEGGRVAAVAQPSTSEPGTKESGGDGEV